MDGIAQFIQSKLQGFQNMVAQRTQPSLISPVPQAQTLPQAQPNFLQQAGNFLNTNIVKPVENEFQQLPQQINKAAPQAANFLFNSNPWNQQLPNIPKITLPTAGNETPLVQRLGYNYLVKPIAENVINTPSDLVKASNANNQMLSQQLQGKSIPASQFLGNLGQTGSAVLNATTMLPGGAAEGAVKDIAANAIGKGSWSQAGQDLVKAGIKGGVQGSAFTGLYGFLQGLANNQNQGVKNQVLNALVNGLQSVPSGFALGTVAAGAANVVGQLKNRITEIRMAQGVSPQQAGQDADNYLRDRFGRFIGLKPNNTFETAGLEGKVSTPNQPLKINDWMDNIDKEIGWNKNNQPSAGLSTKLLTEEEHNANVLPIKQGAKLPIAGNPEPLPWEQAGVNEFAGRQIPPQETQVPFETGSGTKLPDLGTVDKTTGGIVPPGKPSGTLQDALGKRFEVQQTIGQRANVVAQKVDAAVHGPEETALFRNSVEHPENLSENAQKTANPQAFKDAVGQFKQFTDYVHNTANTNGLKLGYLQDYYSHIVDLSNPEDQARFMQYMQAKAGSKGFFTRERVFKNIDDLEEAGFKLKNPNVPLDIQQYARSAIRSIGNSALVQGVNKASPGEVVKISELGFIPRDSQGKNFVASKIPGLEDFAFSPNVQKYIQHLEPKGDSNGILQVYDKLNSLGKEVSLSGGGFHALKTTLRQIGVQLMNFRIPRLDEAFVNAISPSARLAYRERAIADGTIDKASQMGVTLDTVRDVGEEGLLKTAKTLNPISNLHNSLFGGLINTYKLQLVRDANIDNLSPQEARQLGAQINNLMGGLNYDLIRRSPVTQQWLRRVTLAPDFNEGKIRQLLTSVTNTGAAGGFARRAILGEALAVGVLAELGRRLVTGKFSQGLLPALQNSVIDPNIPTNMKDSKGRALSVGLPGSTITDISRAGLGSLAKGDINQAGNDLGQFIQARGSSAISAGTKLVTGKDYYGNPLVKNPEDDNLLTRSEAVLPNMLPIPVVQGMKVAGGQNNLATAAINTLGGRVHIDPNDPLYQQEQRYFQAKDKQYQALTPAQQKLVDAIPKQDPTDPGAKQLKYELIGRDPAVWNYFKNIALADANGDPNKIDPLYKVPYDQAKQYITYEAQNPGSADKSSLYKANPIIGQIAAMRSVFFQNNPIAGSKPSGAPVASQYVQQQMDAKNWKDPQVQQYLNDNTAYNNGLRSQMGLTPIGGSSGGTSSYAKSVQRRMLRQMAKPRTRKVKIAKIAQGKKIALKPLSLGKIASKSLKKPKLAIANPKNKKLKLA